MLWTSGSTAKCEGKALPGLHRTSPLFPCEKKHNKTGRPWKYNAIHILIKNYTYEVTSCAGALSPRSSTACSRCTGPKPCALHRAPCDRPRTAHKKGHLPHGSGIFPVARDTDDEWPFWCSPAYLLRRPVSIVSLHSTPYMHCVSQSYFSFNHIFFIYLTMELLKSQFSKLQKNC